MSVALIGSSGGGVATLGHTNAIDLLRIIHDELRKVGSGSEVSLDYALFVTLHNGKGFDNCNPEKDIATLYAVTTTSQNHEIQIQVIETAPLKVINKRCLQMDVTLAQQIQLGQIQGLICISCSVDVHEASLKAAGVAQIPVTGSGGKSLSEASSRYGISLVGNAGGSVATTTYTRAISYTYALASAWKKDYNASQLNSDALPQWTSVLNACLPAFWAVTLTCRVINMITPYLSHSEWLTEQLLVTLQTQALPTTCCVVMATTLAPQHGSIVWMAASIASIVCQKSILAGLISGFLVSLVVKRTLFQCIIWNIPATMTNLITAGGVGALVATVVAPFVQSLQTLSQLIRWIVQTPMNGNYPGVGFLIGVMCCWGCKVGLYHKIWLPIILLEMELGEPSLWGAIDEATLVLVSAAICSANLLIPLPSDTESKSLCKRGLRINLLFGDFVEAAYPFMEKSLLVNVGGYLASGISTELLTGNTDDIKSMAYLPLPISILLAKDWNRILLSYFVSFSICFALTLLNNVLASSRAESEVKKSS
jgi:hypothetical protein